MGLKHSRTVDSSFHPINRVYQPKRSNGWFKSGGKGAGATSEGDTIHDYAANLMDAYCEPIGADKSVRKPRTAQGSPTATPTGTQPPPRRDRRGSNLGRPTESVCGQDALAVAIANGGEVSSNALKKALVEISVESSMERGGSKRYSTFDKSVRAGNNGRSRFADQPDKTYHGGSAGRHANAQNVQAMLESRRSMKSFRRGQSPISSGSARIAVSTPAVTTVPPAATAAH